MQIRTEPPRPDGALASLSLSMLLSSLGTSIANVGLPSLARAFSARSSRSNGSSFAYLLAITHPHRRCRPARRTSSGAGGLLLAGILLFTVASGLCGAAPSLQLLIARRAVQGLGAGGHDGASTALVERRVEGKDRVAPWACWAPCLRSEPRSGPSLGGVLVAGLGWQAIFLVTCRSAL
ncbi:MFS transporter [Sinorhizobium meliloti]|nr:MFS transporter [Sinorhizobium meliloti]